MGKLDGKVALIAGGLGRFKKEEYEPGLSTYIVQNFITEGADVVIVDLDEKITKACVDYIGSPKVKSKACDILKDRAYETKTLETERGPKTEVIWTDNPTLELVKEIVEEYGKLDALVLNFDHYEKGRLDSVTEETYTMLREQNIELESRRKYIETVLKSVSAGVITIDSKGFVTTINTSAEKMLNIIEKNGF